MKVLLLAVLASLPAMAEVVHIHSTHKAQTRDKTFVLKLTDGRVAFYETAAETLPLAGTFVDLEINEDLSVNAISSVAAAPVDHALTPYPSALFTPDYTPTILANYETAQAVMNDFRKPWSDGSQCYDRAHVWVFEEWSRHQTYLQKAFLFFSDKYIERYNYKWWFHIAPFALVTMQGQTQERILDPAFSKYPLKRKLWTDLFMLNKVECKEITKYSEFSKSVTENDCYILRADMYFWQPRHLESFEVDGNKAQDFRKFDVDWAYEQAFNLGLIDSASSVH